jgi:nitrite reductase/ring-hydroxylating ferredoxin subunit
MSGTLLMTFACRVDDVPVGEGRTITVDGRPIALFRASPVPGMRSTRSARTKAGRSRTASSPIARVICPLHERRYDLAAGAALTDGAAITAHALWLHGTRSTALAADAARAA